MKIVAIAIILCIFFSNIGATEIHSNTLVDCSDPEIEDKPGDAISYIDIQYVDFYIEDTSPDCFFVSMKITDLKKMYHTYFYVDWQYNETLYQILAMYTVSGPNFQSSWNTSWNSLDGSFDFKNDVIQVQVQNVDAGSPASGDQLSHICAYAMQEGFAGMPLVSDYAPDCGYGKDYIIGGGNVERNPELNLGYGEVYLYFRAIEDVESFELYYVAPLNYKYQAPIFFDLKNDSSNTIQGVSIINDTFSPNKLLKFECSSLNITDGLQCIHFDFWVLLKNHFYEDLPTKVMIPPYEDLPKDTVTWLASTEAIQSNNPLIQAAGELIKRSDENVIALSEKIVKFTSFRQPKMIIRYIPVLWKMVGEDALSTLLFSGVCTGRANLAAGLFRANGIPAQDASVFPTTNKWYMNHYICFYYCPEYGWVGVEPTEGKAPVEPSNSILMRINYPEDEDKAGSFFRGYNGVEQWYWFSIEEVEAQWSGTTYSRSRASIEKSLYDTENNKDEALIKTREMWEYYAEYYGSDLACENSYYFENAPESQNIAIQYFLNDILPRSP